MMNIAMVAVTMLISFQYVSNANTEKAVSDSEPRKRDPRHSGCCFLISCLFGIVHAVATALPLYDNVKF